MNITAEFNQNCKVKTDTSVMHNLYYGSKLKSKKCKMNQNSKLLPHNRDSFSSRRAPTLSAPRNRQGGRSRGRCE